MEVGKTVKLNNGYEMPTVGLGTFTMFQNPEGEMARVIAAAIKAGYRHIDTAKVYGTEPLMGPPLAQMIKDGEIKREEIYLTCKVWNTDHHPDRMKAGLEQSLKDLQTDYVDMLLIHWPFAFKAGDALFPKDENDKILFDEDDYLDTWKAMEECVESGKVRSIGLSNFNIEQTKRVLAAAKIKPSNMQIELNAYMNNQELADFCKSEGIVVSCYAPLGSPGRIWKETGEPNLLEDDVVKAIAEKHNKSAAQVAMRFLMQKGYVILPKSTTESRLQANIDVFDFTLTDDEMVEMDKLNKDIRVYAEPIAIDSKDYPFEKKA